MIATSVHLCLINHKGKISTTLLFEQSRVAPAQSTSIPCLELCAAIIHVAVQAGTRVPTPATEALEPYCTEVGRSLEGNHMSGIRGGIQGDVKVGALHSHWWKEEPMWPRCGRHGGLMVSVLDSRASSLGSNHGQGHCVVFSGKTLNSHHASFHPEV